MDEMLQAAMNLQDFYKMVAENGGDLRYAIDYVDQAMEAEDDFVSVGVNERYADFLEFCSIEGIKMDLNVLYLYLIRAYPDNKDFCADGFEDSELDLLYQDEDVDGILCLLAKHNIRIPDDLA